MATQEELELQELAELEELAQLEALEAQSAAPSGPVVAPTFDAANAGVVDTILARGEQDIGGVGSLLGALGGDIRDTFTGGQASIDNPERRTTVDVIGDALGGLKETVTTKEGLIPLVGAGTGATVGFFTGGPLGAYLGAQGGSLAAQELAEQGGVLPDTSIGSKLGNALYDTATGALGFGAGKATQMARGRMGPNPRIGQIAADAANPNAPGTLTGVGASKDVRSVQAASKLNDVFNDLDENPVARGFLDGVDNFESARNKAQNMAELARQNRSKALADYNVAHGDVTLDPAAIRSTEPFAKLDAEIAAAEASGNLDVRDAAMAKRDALNRSLAGYESGLESSILGPDGKPIKAQVPLTLERLQSDIDAVNNELRELKAYDASIEGRAQLDPSQKARLETAQQRQAALLQSREQLLQSVDPALANNFLNANRDYGTFRNLEDGFSQAALNAGASEAQVFNSALGKPNAFDATLTSRGSIVGDVFKMADKGQDVLAGRDTATRSYQEFAQKRNQESLRKLRERQMLLEGRLSNNPITLGGQAVQAAGKGLEYAGTTQAVVPTQVSSELVAQQPDQWAEYIFQQASMPMQGESPELAQQRAGALAQDFLEVMTTGHNREKRRIIAELQAMGLMPQNPIKGEVDGHIERPQDRQDYMNNRKTDLRSGNLSLAEYVKQQNAMADPYNGKLITTKDQTAASQGVKSLLGLVE